MSKIVTVSQMRSIERESDAAGWTYDDMMLAAGASIAGAILARLEAIAGLKVLILVGTGNNGGDGLVTGGLLAERGAQVTAYLAGKRPETDPHLARLRALGATVLEGARDTEGKVLDAASRRADVVVDALLGTGFRLPLRPSAGRVLSRVGSAMAVREARGLVVAVDCPSGLDCDSGEVAPEVLKADLTVTLAAAKPGLLRSPGADFAGEIVVGDIGLRPGLKSMGEVLMEFVDQATVKPWVPNRPSDGHKGTFGTAMIAGGSINYPGSVGLAGIAAYRVGAGLVCLAVPGSIQSALVPLLPEATWVVLPQQVGVIAESAAEVLRREAGRADVLLLGPGLGRDDATRRFVERFLETAEGHGRSHIGFIHGEQAPESAPAPLPRMIVDADGLRLVASLEGWAKRLPAPAVLTPHPGEMSALTGLDVKTIQGNREGIAREYASGWGHVVVLKGARTVIAAPDGRAWILPFATSSLAKGGTGDVLGGAIAGLCAQGVGAIEAAVLAGYLHGRAALRAEADLGTPAGVLASEVARRLPEALAELA